MQKRPVFSNIDSVGWSRHFEESEWRSWLNLSEVNESALEVSGDLSTLPEFRLSLIRRTLELSDPFNTLRCPDFWRGAYMVGPLGTALTPLS